MTSRLEYLNGADEIVDPVTWEIRISRNSSWPTPWEWETWKRSGAHTDLRTGYARTKERARRKALKAKQSMENDDVRVTYS